MMKIMLITTFEDDNGTFQNMEMIVEKTKSVLHEK